MKRIYTVKHTMTKGDRNISFAKGADGLFYADAKKTTLEKMAARVAKLMLKGAEGFDYDQQAEIDGELPLMTNYLFLKSLDGGRHVGEAPA